MRKNIKKLITVGVVISVINNSIMPAFAAGVTENLNDLQSSLSYERNKNNSVTPQSIKVITEKKILTLNKAIEGAINNSNKLELKSKEIDMYEAKMDLQEKYDDYYDTINQTVYDFPYNKLKAQKKQTKQSEEFLKDKITSDITNKFNNIVLKEINIDKSKRNLELKKKDLNYMKAKLDYGLATPNMINDAQIEIKSLQDEITEKENTLNNNKDYFNVLTNLDLKDTYILDHNNINYEKFKINDSVDDYMDNRLDFYFKYDAEILNLSKHYMDDLKDDDIDDIMDKDTEKMPDKSSCITANADSTYTFDSGSYALKLIQYQQKQQEYYTKLNAYNDYLDGKYTVSEKKVKLDDTKKNIKNVLKENYSVLLDLENKIDTMKEQIDSRNMKLRFAKMQVDKGLMLENDYDKQVLAGEDLDSELRTLIYTHNNLRDSIQKPWILSNE